MGTMKITVSVPFGGVCGWLADVTLPERIHRKTGIGRRTQSYFSAEPERHRALAAIRSHANVGADANIVFRRALSRREVNRLKLRSGEVRPT